MNQAINFFWTIVSFIPVLIYWAHADSLMCCYVFIAVAFISLTLPAKLLQLSNSVRLYEKLGIKFIRKFVQDGEFARRLQQKAQPGFRFIKDKRQAVAYLNTIRMYERFHILCFTFFMLTFIHSVCYHNYTLAAIIFLANIIYNVYPILLQQYNGIKIERIL
jgi:hypothetical protein